MHDPLTEASPYRDVIEGMFRVVDPEARDSDVTLRLVQARLDANWTRRNIIAKSRRHGISTYVIWRFIAKCLTMQNRRCMLVSHEKEATARLFSIARYTLNNLKGGVQADVGRNNRGELYFNRTNSTFWIGTAGADNLGHGDTITDLHWSEAAHTANAEDLRKGLFPAAEAGEITVESTGNGVGNWFHNSVIRAAEGHGFALHFFPYTEHPDSWLEFRDADHSAAFLADLRPEYGEPELVGLLEAERLHWRRDKIDVLFEGNLRDFTEQYPRTLEECFQATGHSIFKQINFVPSASWRRRGACLWALAEHPTNTGQYVIGADVSAGVGRDNSVAQVVSLDRMEQVAEWVSNGVDPDLFGIELAHLAGMFNKAYVNVEQNTFGLTTLRSLAEHYPHHLIHQGRPNASRDSEYATRRVLNYGTLVSERVKGAIIGGLRSALRGELTIHSELLKMELGSFVETEAGKLEAEANCKDDRVMALAHAVACIERAALAMPSPARAKPMAPAIGSWEDIFGDAEGRQEMGFLPFKEGRWV